MPGRLKDVSVILVMAQQDTQKATGRNFIGGLIEGVNFPRGKKFPILELLECNDVILVTLRF